jgi:hypothetical protein
MPWNLAHNFAKASESSLTSESESESEESSWITIGFVGDDANISNSSDASSDIIGGRYETDEADCAVEEPIADVGGIGRE